MRYLSVCSGIEAASVAWHLLGWTPVAFAEIEKFPSAVLAHHYPSVPNWGDMTRFHEWPDATLDLLVGGTPCQSFSVAGLRKGMADPRGNLALTYLAILDRYRPTWCCWENVPGVLSSGGGWDFGAFLGGLGKLGYGFAYRVLDAQFFGVAQRRRRVFVVANLGGWRRAAAVLFDGESLSGHPAPRREAGQGATYGTVPSLTASGRGVERTGESRGQDPVIPVTVGALTDGAHMGGGSTAKTPTRVVSSLANPLTARMGKGINSTLDEGQTPVVEIGGSFDVAHALRAEGFDASEDGTGRGTPLVPAAIAIHTANTSASGQGIAENVAHTLDQAQGQAIAFDARQSDAIVYGDKTGPLDTDGHSTAISVALRGREGGGTAELCGDVSTALRTGGGGGDKPHVMTAMAVRRLTPRECERLQGFPDDYTLIPYRGKPAVDGPRYKALGNSMAVPVMRWIGKRIQMVNEISG